MCIIYRGGKKQTKEKIIEILPSAEMFVDVFGGGGSVSGEAVRSGKYKQVIYNDINSHLVNFMKVVRDNKDEFVDYLEQTPLGRYLKDELDLMLESENTIERAASIFFSHNFKGSPTTGKSGSGFFRPHINKKGRNIVRGNHTRDLYVQKIKEVSEIFKQIYFDNRDAEEILKIYGKPVNERVNQVFFLDPPYGDTKDYGFDFPEQKLIEFFLNTEWTVALCGEEEQYPELCDYEFVLLSGSSFRKDGSYRQGMWLKFR